MAESAAAAEAITQAARAPPRGARARDKESTSIRVGVEKVDQIINLVGELVITRPCWRRPRPRWILCCMTACSTAWSSLERNARDLQEAVMSIRMMPMDYVFSRFPRLVRDIAGKMGKQIELQTYGRATELDKSLIERIIDPLTHLVRNSLTTASRRPRSAWRPARIPWASWCFPPSTTAATS